MPADPRLSALLDTVIPAGDGMPSADEVGLLDTMLADAAGTSLGQGLDTVLSLLPADFDTLDADAREDAVRSVTDRAEDAVAAVVNLVYTAYYTSKDVLELIESRTGFHAGPPQPRGYRLAPFDPALVDRVQRRGHAWRALQ